MKSREDILSDNPTLLAFSVVLIDRESGGDFDFDCYAENDDHAAEQAQDAYPTCQILKTTRE